MVYVVVVPDVGTFDFTEYDDARQAVKLAKALGADAWNTIVPDDDELDGSAGEGCSS